MRLAWTSDLHLVFLKSEDGFLKSEDGLTLQSWLDQLAAEDFDALAISGDISEAPRICEHLELLETHIQRPIYFVLGNHDFYRGSFETVLPRVREFAEQSPLLHCLDFLDFVELTDTTALVGHGCWADGLYGDFWQSEIVLNDWKVIDELRKWKRGPFSMSCFGGCGACLADTMEWHGGAVDVDRELMAEELKKLGERAAEHIRRVLPRALAARRHVVLLTHTPPFAPRCVSTKVEWERWAPHAGCKLAGDVIEEIMEAHPDRQLLILSGHVHAASWIQISANIEQRTASAQYGQPHIEDLIELPAC